MDLMLRALPVDDDPGGRHLGPADFEVGFGKREVSRGAPRGEVRKHPHAQTGHRAAIELLQSVRRRLMSPAAGGGGGLRGPLRRTLRQRRRVRRRQEVPGSQGRPRGRERRIRRVPRVVPTGIILGRRGALGWGRSCGGGGRGGGGGGGSKGDVLLLFGRGGGCPAGLRLAPVKEDVL